MTRKGREAKEDGILMRTLRLGRKRKLFLLAERGILGATKRSRQESSDSSSVSHGKKVVSLGGATNLEGIPGREFIGQHEKKGTEVRMLQTESRVHLGRWISIKKGSVMKGGPLTSVQVPMVFEGLGQKTPKCEIRGSIIPSRHYGAVNSQGRKVNEEPNNGLERLTTTERRKRS